MELNRISEEMEKRARTLWKDVEGGFKRIEKKAQPTLDKARKEFDRVLHRDVENEGAPFAELRERLLSEGKQLKTRTTTWFDETYTNLLDSLGVATKDEVEALRRKLSSLQRRLREFAKPTTHN
ncbi:MAG: hypothetical protein C4523_05575 [Myxococcales bacterium]|nr:MAG: hypothetical protein C4523_05575 [Myxococcales bacterium]